MGVKSVKVPKVKLPKKENAPINTMVKLSAPEFIIGLDMSLEHTGWCLYNVQAGTYQYGLFEPAGKIRGMERLGWVRERVMQLVLYGNPEGLVKLPAGQRQDGVVFPREQKRIKALVLIEGYAFMAKGSAMLNIAELGGLIRWSLYNAHIPYIEIAPTALKKFISGKGMAKKNLMLKEVLKRFGADFNDDNEADAYALMMLGRGICAGTWGDKPPVSFQVEVITDVVKMYFKEYPNAPSVAPQVPAVVLSGNDGASAASAAV